MMAALEFKPRRRSIGLTALIDVVFILLMFFMLTSTFNRFHAVDFQPLVASQSQDEIKTQVVFLKDDLSLLLQGKPKRVDHYTALNAAQVGWFQSDRPIILVPDADVSIQHIVGALDRLRGLGIGSVNYGGVAVSRSSSQSLSLSSVEQ